MNDSERHKIVRPTEAQLRWAQFHHKRTAATVKEAVEAFWQQPAAVKDVEGAQSDDGNTTEESTTKITMIVPRTKPNISRGRRAMLRVSKRAWETRRHDIEKYGFRCGDYAGCSDSESSDDGLAAIFAEESFRKKRKRRHNRRMASDDEERVRRFEAAFHAMMMNLAASQQPNEPEIEAPSKIWTRPDVPLMETVDGREYADLKWGVMPKGSVKNPKSTLASTPMDRGASWLVHLPTATKRSTSQINPAVVSSSHTTCQDSEGVVDYETPEFATEDGRPVVSSPMRKKFTDIVAKLQQQAAEVEDLPQPELTTPTMRLSKYFIPAKLDDDDEKKEDDVDRTNLSEGAAQQESVQDKIKRLSTSPQQREKFVDDIVGRLDPELVLELDEVEPGFSHKVLAKCLQDAGFDPVVDEVDEVLPYLDVFVRRYLAEVRFSNGQLKSPATPRTDARRSSGLVKRFVAQIEHAADEEDLISADGKLHKPTFAKLVNQYLLGANEPAQFTQQSSKASPLATGVSNEYLASIQDNHERKEGVNDEDLNTSSSRDIVNRFVARMEDASENEFIVASSGKLNREAFEKMVTRYLAEASGTDEETVMDVADMQTLETLSSRTRERRQRAEPVVDPVERLSDDQKRGSRAVQDKLAAFGEDRTPAKDIPGGRPRLEIPSSFVKHFVTQLEQAAEVEPLLAPDGTLAKPVFEKLVHRYMENAITENGSDPFTEARSPLALASARRSAAKSAKKSTSHRLHDVTEDEVLVLGPESQLFVERFIVHMEQAAEKEVLVNAAGRLNRPAFEKLVERNLDLASRETEDVASKMMHESKTQAHSSADTKRQSIPPSAVKKFVAQMEQGTNEECLVTSDGKLNEPIFEKLVRRYLAEATSGSGIASKLRVNGDGGELDNTDAASERPQSDTLDLPTGNDSPHSQTMSTDRIQELIKNLERAASEEESFLTADGSLDVSTFEKLVNRYMQAGRSHDSESDQRQMYNQKLSQRDHHLLPANKSVAFPGQKVDPTHSTRDIPSEIVSPAETDFFGEIRRMGSDTDKSRLAVRSAVSELTYDSAPRLADDGAPHLAYDGAPPPPPPPGPPPDHHLPHFKAALATAETHIQYGSTSIDRRIDEGDHICSTEDESGGMSSKFAGSVSSKVGGFIKMLYNKQPGDIETGRRMSSPEELQAVAAFRKTQGDRDDASSHSSFRVLPDGIKNIVRNFRPSALSPRDETDEEYEHEETASSQSHYSGSSYLRQTDSRDSSSKSEPGHSGVSEISAEKAKIFHRMVMEKSALIGAGGAEQSIIDTDGSDASVARMDADVLANLLLSPTILTKRHQQAIRAVETRNWEQVSYLLSANPWLAEMTDLNTNQYLLHKLALYGAGEAIVDQNNGEVISQTKPAAPEQINTDLVRMFPSSVHKFDRDGNLPLHMAAASANLAMIKLLGDRFPSGASVRNIDGLLPLHLTILACATPQGAVNVDGSNASEIIKAVLDYFPGAVAVCDNDGNLPIHTAASVLKGEAGVDVIYLLLDEAERQVNNPSGVRFRNKVRVEDIDNMSAGTETVGTETTASVTDSANNDDDVIHCNMVLNESGDTPLMVAIRARAGWETIEAIAHGPGGVEAALWQDAEMNNALHLLVSDRHKDAAAALSILKIAPETASQFNEDGMLPVEVACMQMLPQEVILALVLVDLPIDLDRKDNVELREGLGGSWWFLSCECDDHYVDVVREVISLCSYPQARALCFMKGKSDETLISRATPKCREIFKRALRFVGRFEFLGSSAVSADDTLGIKTFDALDFGAELDPIDDGRRVLLKCYAREEVYARETGLLRENTLDFSLLEEVLMFAVGKDGEQSVEQAQQFCVAVERPNLTLAGVVTGMLGNADCQTDSQVRQRYSLKVFSVLRIIAKGLRHLHSMGVIHGNLCLENCGKYGDKWKISDILGIEQVGAFCDVSRFSESAPPETVEPTSDAAMEHHAAFRTDVTAQPAIDSWGYGKLTFEVLVGESLVEFDNEKDIHEDHRALTDIMHWNAFVVDEVRQKLTRVGISNAGADLISQCLAPEPEQRPSMDEILNHSVWKELRRQSQKAQRDRK